MKGRYEPAYKLGETPLVIVEVSDYRRIEIEGRDQWVSKRPSLIYDHKSDQFLTPLSHKRMQTSAIVCLDGSPRFDYLEEIESCFFEENAET